MIPKNPLTTVLPTCMDPLSFVLSEEENAWTYWKKRTMMFSDPWIILTDDLEKVVARSFVRRCGGVPE